MTKLRRSLFFETNLTERHLLYIFYTNSIYIHIITQDRESGLLRKAISKISTEYRLQFAWPQGHTSRRDATDASAPRKSQSMGAIKPAANAIIHKKRNDIENKDGTSKRHIATQCHLTLIFLQLVNWNPWLTRRRFKKTTKKIKLSTKKTFVLFHNTNTPKADLQRKKQTIAIDLKNQISLW